MEDTYEIEYKKFHQALQVFMDFYLELAKDHYTNFQERDASMLMQKLYLHSLSIFELSSKSVMQSATTGKLLEILDPVSMNTLLRSQFETYCCINHVFIEPNGKEDKHLRYLLWKQAGMNSRVKSPARLKVNKLKQKRELLEIQQIQNQIEKTKKFKSLNSEGRKRLKKHQKMRNWKLKIYNGQVYDYHWYKLFLRAGMRKPIFGNQYNYMSLNSHPTYISVIQINDMYEKGYFKQNAKNVLFMSKMMIYGIILDSSSYFPNGPKVFKGLKQNYQKEIIAFNKTFRYKSKVNNLLNEIGIKT